MTLVEMSQQDRWSRSWRYRGVVQGRYGSSKAQIHKEQAQATARSQMMEKRAVECK